MLNAKEKENIKRSTRKMTCHIKGNSNKIFNFSVETWEARRPQDDIVKELKEENCQPRKLNSVKLCFKNKG